MNLTRTVVALLLSSLTLACASTKLAGRDVVAVAKAPAKEWKKVAVASAVVGATVLLDDEIARVAQRNDSRALDGFTGAVESFGGGTSDKVIAGFLLYGVAAKDERARAVAFDSIIASVIASKAITPAIKQLAPRDRPGDGDDESFPSNHATQAFALATVVASHYDQRWVKWLAYGIAGSVGFSRVYHDDHWASDVLAGAAIGALVGRTVVITNRGERAKWTFAPTRRGVLVSLSF